MFSQRREMLLKSRRRNISVVQLAISKSKIRDSVIIKNTRTVFVLISREGVQQNGRPTRDLLYTAF